MRACLTRPLFSRLWPSHQLFHRPCAAAFPQVEGYVQVSLSHCALHITSTWSSVTTREHTCAFFACAEGSLLVSHARACMRAPLVSC